MANDILNLENRDKVMAKGAFAPEPKAGYSNDIFGILISVGLIFGGLSGRMVLRGTNSSPALVVAGFVFLVIDIVSMVKKKGKLVTWPVADLYDRLKTTKEKEKLEQEVRETYRIITGKELTGPVIRKEYILE